jgi:hypothetical protein
MTLDEIFEEKRHVAQLQITASGSCATSAETSCDQLSAVLKETTRTGLLY